MYKRADAGMDAGLIKRAGARGTGAQYQVWPKTLM